MPDNLSFRYLKHSEIDFLLWNQCVISAPNARIYGTYEYLNCVCQPWDALVTENYEQVMPLPWKKKWGLSYLYQPWFAQQLGVFGKATNEIKKEEIVKAIPLKFIKYHIVLNSGNPFKTSHQRLNYILPLHKSYQELKKGYSENTLRNLKKASNQSNSLNTIVPADEFIEFKLKTMETNFNPAQRTVFKTLVHWLSDSKMGVFAGVRNQNADLISAVCWVFFANRILYLFAASNPEGKTSQAMTLLVDTLIKQHAETKNCIDFEGSSIEGVARFYKGFGATTETFYQLKGSLLQRWMM